MNQHAAITLALDAGVPLHEVQDFAGHRHPRSTRRYDRARNRLDRHASYTLAAQLLSVVPLLVGLILHMVATLVVRLVWA